MWCEKSFSSLGTIFSPVPRHQCPVDILSTPLWYLKTGMKGTLDRYCCCCSSPWQHCRFHGDHLLHPHCRCCLLEAWVWWWRTQAAGASSCWSCVPLPGGFGTRSSPGTSETQFSQRRDDVTEARCMHESRKHVKSRAEFCDCGQYVVCASHSRSCVMCLYMYI